MTTSLGWLLIVLAGSFTEIVNGGETCQDPNRLIVCHIETELHPSTDPCSCTHLVIHRPHDPDVIKAAGKLREKNRRLKILSLTHEGKKNLLEDGVSGVYLKLSKSLSKESVIKNVKALATELDNLQASKRANAKYTSENSDSKDIAEIILELPTSPEQLAKNYDLKSLNKYVNYFIISSDNLTDSSEEGLAYHPSRLMGIDDILNADSLVDLISGLGAEHEKLLVSLPATALKFNLKDPKDNMPRAKVTAPPESISQKELCSLIENGVWTLERDEDLTAPYAYSSTTWLAFDDSVSAAIKAKYVLLRGLAGIAVSKSEADDWGHVCASRPILDTIYSTFTNLVRKPRAATLLSLQDQIHNSISPFAGDIQLSPYRIVRVVDRAGSVHVVRKEAKTEFQCSRQGYFTHPSGCNRFYRCVKFNQYSSDFTVFEYDCPAGLAFDERYEVCVWPGSLPDASACKGSSEIAPVPRSRFACSAQGYFADPENCRWFFACLDHHGDGRAPTAYEFRCPFGLVFNEKTLTCDWPWSVPGCGGGSGSVIHTSSIYPGDILEGRLRPAYAQVSDLHVSGGRISDVDGGLVLGTNLLSGISTSGQRYSNGYSYGLANQINSAFGNSKYEDNSGAYIHDPTGDTGGEYIHEEGPQGPHGTGSRYSEGQGLSGSYITTGSSGQYVHDSRGDNTGQYVHSEGSSGTGSYSSLGASDGYYAGGKVSVTGGTGLDNSGTYVHDSRGDTTGHYIHSQGSQGSGLYSSSGATGYYAGGNVFVSGGSGIDNSGAYVHDSRGDTGGAYVHQEGPDGPGSKPYIHSGSSSIQYGGTGTIATAGQLNSYEIDHSGETGGANAHQIVTSGPSSVIYSGIKSSGSDISGSSGAQLTADFHQSGINRGQAYFGAKTANTLSSGSYVHDSRGDSGGAYVHHEGSSGPESISYIQQQGLFNDHNFVSGSVKTSQEYATHYRGGQQLGIGGYTGGSYASNSGQYIHDSTGDKGGDYIHQEGPSGPGPVSYVHQEGTYLENGLRGGSNIKTGQSYTTNYVGQNIVGIGGITTGTHSSASSSGHYIHDSRGDTGGEYVHQQGPSYYQGAYADRYSGQYIHDNSGAYVHDTSGYYTQPYVHQDGPSGPSGPLYQGVNIYNRQYAGQYASKYATDHKHLIHYGNTNIDGAHLYQPEEGIIHTYDSSRLHVQPLGYKGSVLKPVGITKVSSIPLNPVQYLSPVTKVHPVSVTTPSPVVLTEIKSHKIQPITVTEKPIIPLNPVQYITPLNGVQNSGLQSLSLVKGSEEISHSFISPTVHTKTYRPLTVNNYQQLEGVKTNIPVTYNQEAVVNNGFLGYEYSKPKITFSYPEHIVKHQQAVQPTSISHLTGYSYHPSVPVQTVNTAASQPVIKTNVVSPVFISSTPRPDLVSYKEPTIDSHIVRPVSVTSSPIVPLNPVQYGTKIETIQVSTPAPPRLVSSHIYNPIIKTQTVSPIIVSSTPAIPLSPVQYGTKFQTFEGSTPAPPLVSSHSYNPIIKTQTVHPVIISSTPAVPLNPVQYGIKTISSSVGYHYSKPVVGLSYPKEVYSTQSPPVISYTYQKPLVKTQPIHPVVSTPALPDVSISHEIPIQQISINKPAPSFGYSYKQPLKPVIPVSVSTPAPPVVSYSYQQPIKPVVPIAVSTPAPPVVSYSTTPRPIVVSSTPIVPLNPVQYVNPISFSTPAPPTFGYSYNKPIKPFVPVSVSSPSPPVVSYSYQQPIKPVVPIAVSTPAPPVVSYSYRQPVRPVAISTHAPAVVSYSTTPRPIVVSSTPAIPLNPVQYVNPVSFKAPSPPPTFGYSYKQPIKPFVPVSVSSPSPPVVSYSYQQPIKPVVPIAVSTPAPPVVSYSYRQPVRPVAISTPAPAVVSYSTTPRPIVVSSTPAIPLNPVQYVNPVSFRAPSPPPTFGYSYKQPIKPVIPVSVSTPAPPVVSYSYQQPIKPVVPIAVSTPASPVVSYSTTPRPIVVSSTPTVPLNPVQYVNPISFSTPAPPTFGYSYKKPIKPFVPVSVSSPSPVVSYTYQQPIKPAVNIAVSTPAPPVVSYSYRQPVRPVAISTPAPAVVSYSTTPRPIVVSSTPAIPLNPVQYVNPVSFRAPSPPPTFGYSYKQPIKPVIPVSVSTPAPPVLSYSYQQPIKPVVPIAVSTPAHPVVSYSTTPRPIVVSSTPTVPLNPVQYVNPVSFSTPAPPTFGYSYNKPIKPLIPVSVSSPAPPVVSYSTTPRPLQPIVVSSTPSVPLNPVQYFNPGLVNIPTSGYSYKQPLKPISFNIPVSTSAPPSVTYSYRQQVPVSTPAPPAVKFSYQESVKSEYSPQVHYQTPLKPVVPVTINKFTPPVVSYSYQTPTTPAPSVIVSTPAPFTSQSLPVQHVKQVNSVVSPINTYSYKQPLAPVSVHSPAPPSITYSHPAPFSTSAPALSYNVKGVQSISVSTTPAVPLNPVQYIKHVTTPIPTASYSYNRPLDQSAVNKATNIVFSYTFDSKPVRPVTVSSTPAIPLNPVQYSVTPVPSVTYRPVSTYSTPSVPVVNYSYRQPSLKTVYNRPLQPAVITTHAPEITYSYKEEPDYFLKLKTVRPVSVTSTPVVPLNPVQYVSTTPRPIINYQYQNPVIKTHTSVVAPAVDYYDEEVLHRDISKIQPKPTVGTFYEVPTRTTTVAPITVTSTPVVPLNPVQYVKHSQPVFSYNYNYAQPAPYNTKGCCSSPSLKVSSTPKPYVLKTTAYPSTIISSKKPVVGAYFEENYEANRQEEGYVYSRPNIKFQETPVIKGIYSTPSSYNRPAEVTTPTYLHRPVQTYANTVEEESYISNTPEHVTTLVKQPISVDTNDEDLNLHLDIPKIGINRPVYTTTSTPQQQIVEVTTVTPVVKRVRVKGGLTRGGYYVRRQKVKVQPVITTTENYPAYFTPTIKPIYSSTIDLSSPTLYSTTVRPTTVYTTPSTTLKDDELEVEDEDYDAKLIEQVSGQFGEIINAGNQGIIRQGVSTTTVSSLKDGETIVGVVKKERVAGGRNKAKVVVVSKLSDFNPLLVGKLGAECSCKSNSKTLNLQRGSSGTRGQLFYPEVHNTRLPSREYLPTSSEPPKVDDYYLPASEVPFVHSRASTTEASNNYDDQSYVEIRPINKVQKFYTSTGSAIDISSTEYDTTTKRSISSNKIEISQEKSSSKGASFDRYGPGGLRGSDEALQGSVDCQRAGLFRHPKYCNKFYACNWDQWKKRFTLHVFNCPIHLAYDSQLGACNWPSKGPACADDNLLV